MRIQNKIAFLCLFSGGSLCIGSDNVDIQKNDEAFCGIFTDGGITLEDSRPEDIMVFLQMLRDCLANPVGKKTVKLLSDIIKTEGGKLKRKEEIIKRG